MKPMLFNTEMVQAILEGRKTVTRRLIKPQPEGDGTAPEPLKTRPGYWNAWGDDLVYKQPYKIGDVLYVRETWQFIPCIDCGLNDHGACRSAPTTYEDKEAISEGCFVYKEDYPEPERICWHPSIHMPKQAARIFLRVTEIWPDRLQNINSLHAKAEGCEGFVHINPLYGVPETVHNFKALWDSTLKPSDRPIYGWEANPWVWVVGFERVSKEVAEA